MGVRRLSRAGLVMRDYCGSDDCTVRCREGPERGATVGGAVPLRRRRWHEFAIIGGSYAERSAGQLLGRGRA